MLVPQEVSSMSQNKFQRPDLPYRYEFGVTELDEIKDCHDAHGFAVVKGVLSSEYRAGGFISVSR